jgi:hypothetical protein
MTTSKAEDLSSEKSRNLLHRLVPIFVWLPSYQMDWLRTDLLAGLAVWALAVPQAMAYAGIAGVPAVYGLYALPLALIAYAVFGTSRTLGLGPDSALAMLSAATVGALAAQGSEEFLALSIALALIVGVLFIIFGLLRLGWDHRRVTPSQPGDDDPRAVQPGHTLRLKEVRAQGTGGVNFRDPGHFSGFYL